MLSGESLPQVSFGIQQMYLWSRARGGGGMTFKKAIKSELKEWQDRNQRAVILAFLACVCDRRNGGDGRFEIGQRGEGEG